MDRPATRRNESDGYRAGGRLPRTLLGVGVLLLMAAAALPAVAGLGDYRCTDNGRVYHGNARLIRTPAVVSADRVYAQISEYQTILREGLTDEDVRYHFLLKEASKKFSNAVKSMARSLGYDFVAEIGAVEVVKEGAPEPPDQTSEVISRLG